MKPGFTRWTSPVCGCEILEYRDENGVLRAVSQEEADILHRQIFRDYPKNTIDPDKKPQRPNKVCKKHEAITDHKELYKTMNDDCKKLREQIV